MPRSSATSGSGPSARFKRAKQLEARRLDPLAVDRGLFLGGNRPIGLESAKVVEAHDVVELDGAANAIDPPAKSNSVCIGRRKNVPAIKRIAPALAGR